MKTLRSSNPDAACKLRAALLMFALGLPLAPAWAMSGAERYAQDCAGCHGEDARGNGPDSQGLAIPPSNLRQLTARDGTFPEDYVRRVIDGRDLPSAHGTVAMPVWGSEYKRALPGQGERLVQEKLDALVGYLLSIQDPPAPPPPVPPTTQP